MRSMTIGSSAGQLQSLAADVPWVVQLFLRMVSQLQVGLAVGDAVVELEEEAEVEDCCIFPRAFEIPFACKFPYCGPVSILETPSLFSFLVPAVTQRRAPSVPVVQRVDLATIVESVVDFEKRLDSTCFRTIEHMF